MHDTDERSGRRAGISLMSYPRVSAIIIFFNAERFLKEAIQSVLAQDFNSWELILVDDGSTNSGTAIARSFTSIDHRIRFVTDEHRRNLGTAAARQMGIDHSRGEFIAFLDADDLWEHTKLADQVSKF